MTRSTLCWLLNGLLLFYAGVIHAQAACPPGTIPYGTGQGQNMCGPDDIQNQQASPPPQPPQPLWESRWGAIATDGDGGSFGASTNLATQKSAEGAALADCRSKKESSTCKVELSYVNQCAAMVAGDIGYNTQAGLTADIAVQKGMKVCSAATTHCYAYYSACSLPIRIQ